LHASRILNFWLTKYFVYVEQQCMWSVSIPNFTCLSAVASLVIAIKPQA
jgi:hypothetical protein